MFATDAQALAVAQAAVEAGFDLRAEPELRAFFYLPFMHSEALAMQDESVALNRGLGGEPLRFAVLHRNIIEQFGRFPHRNVVLQRNTTPEEQRFLDQGGFAG
jgi:uncharacterized protein (DUF924 family)